MKNTKLVAVLLCASVLPATMPAAELPVRTVVLYKHGVGYFEREGALAPGESARLDFKAVEMNDVLKSLTVNDQSGKVTGLRYDSNIPLDRKLTDFPFRIESGQPLSALIDQLKGARIEMEFGAQRVAGAIVSARLMAGDKDHAEREQLTLLMDTGELRNVDLAAASAIRFTDARLQTRFRDYLAALTSSRSEDQRSVYIDSTDSKARTVRAEYIVPMPAWKSSYRLLFGDSGQPMLEGWAIVDNTTGEDWSNVRLSLVSGKPISFIGELYDPKYIKRPEGDLPEDQAVAPTLHTGAIEQDAARLPRQPAPFRMAGNASSLGSVGGVIGGFPSPSPAAQPSTVSQVGQSQEIADLFEYAIPTPKPLETARDVYRFEIALPANGTVDFPVTEERVYDTQTSVSSLNSPALLAYIQNKTLSDAARRQLQQIADMKTQIAKVDAEKQAVTEEINNTMRDEERNRQNIASLSSVSGQQQTVQDYARKLADQEIQIGKLRDRQTALDGQVAMLDF
jgi:hypothetical protein